MDKTSIEFGKWRVVRIDTLNWQLSERKEIKNGKRKGEVDFVRLPNYFGRLTDAVVFARNREFEQGGYEGELDGAVKALRKLDRDFLAAVKEAVGE